MDGWVVGCVEESKVLVVSVMATLTQHLLLQLLHATRMQQMEGQFYQLPPVGHCA